MPVCYLAPAPLNVQLFIPGSAVPANGAQLFFYENLTSTKTTVYKDPAGAVAWSNPLVLGSGGELPSDGTIWIPTGVTITAKFCPANDTDPPTSPYDTWNNLTGVNDVAAQSGVEWVLAGTPTFVSGTSFTLTGDQTAIFQVGRRVKSANTGGTIYSRITASVFGALTTVTVVSDSGTLDSGLSSVWYSVLEATNPSLPLVSDNQPLRKGTSRPTAVLGLEIDGITAGTTRTWTAQDRDIVVADVLDTHGRCRLQYVNASTITLVPCNGNKIVVGSTPYAIPTAGVSLTNTGLVSSTLYYIYAYATSGTLALEASVTTHVTNSSNGVEIRSSDASRSLVGMTYMAAGSPGTFAESVTQRFVRTWFNRRRVEMYATNSPGSKTNTSYAELNTTLRLEFCNWSTEAWVANVAGTAYLVTGGATATTLLGYNVDVTSSAATATEVNVQQNGTTFGTPTPISTVMMRTTGEGYHFVTPVNRVSSDTHAYISFNSYLTLIG
jgi:hypothetical protein